MGQVPFLAEVRVTGALLIAGPTASGKSSLAMRLAQAVNGSIINADSMQIYRGLPVLTACPSLSDRQDIPHYLYEIVAPDQVFSVAQWIEAAMAAARSIWDDGRLPIFVGGTGMYLRALTGGLADIPDIPLDVRRAVRLRMQEWGPERCHADLAVKDPPMAARLEVGDRQRIARALEVFEATGTSLSQWQARTPPGPLAPLDQAGALTKLVIEWPREALYQRCDDRFLWMLDHGAEAEVAALSRRGLNEDHPIRKALGVSMIADYQAGRIDREEMILLGQRQTRRYAKRQMTWLRNQFADWQRINGPHRQEDIDPLVGQLKRAATRRKEQERIDDAGLSR